MTRYSPRKPYERQITEEDGYRNPVPWKPSISNLLNAVDLDGISRKPVIPTRTNTREARGANTGGFELIIPDTSRVGQLDQRGFSLSPTSSAAQSPGAFTPSSSSSQSSGANFDLRKSKPEYTMEQMLFQWYYRVDQDKPWEQVAECYSDRFEPRSKIGLECRFYRTLHDHYGVPKRRDQPKWAEDHGEKYQTKNFGVISWLERPTSRTPKIARILRSAMIYDWVKSEDRERFGQILSTFAEIEIDPAIQTSLTAKVG